MGVPVFDMAGVPALCVCRDGRARRTVVVIVNAYVPFNVEYSGRLSGPTAPESGGR